MDLNLSGKKALVTGASKGIGLGIAKRLVNEGCHVRLVARNESDLQAAQAKLASLDNNVSVTYSALDLSVTSQVEKLAEQSADIDV